MRILKYCGKPIVYPNNILTSYFTCTYCRSEFEVMPDEWICFENNIAVAICPVCDGYMTTSSFVKTEKDKTIDEVMNNMTIEEKRKWLKERSR